MSRYRRQERRPARRSSRARLPPRPRWLVVTEGAVTEIEYLKDLNRHYTQVVLDCRATDCNTPRALVEAALRIRQKASKDDYDSTWCLFDRDTHRCFHEAIDLASSHDVHVGWSAPCFELWLLLHLADPPGGHDCDGMGKLLRRHVPAYRKRMEFASVEPGLRNAMDRAERLATDRDGCGDDPYTNPGTSVHHLLLAMGL